jgi:hypothetical protein
MLGELVFRARTRRALTQQVGEILGFNDGSFDDRVGRLSH